MSTLEEAYDAEIRAYYVLEAERAGNPVHAGDLKNRRVSTKRVDEAWVAWKRARRDLKAAGGTPAALRELLEARAATGTPERRKIG